MYCETKMYDSSPDDSTNWLMQFRQLCFHNPFNDQNGSVNVTALTTATLGVVVARYGSDSRYTATFKITGNPLLPDGNTVYCVGRPGGVEALIEEEGQAGAVSLNSSLGETTVSGVVRRPGQAEASISGFIFDKPGSTIRAVLVDFPYGSGKITTHLSLDGDKFRGVYDRAVIDPGDRGAYDVGGSFRDDVLDMRVQLSTGELLLNVSGTIHQE